VLLYGSRPRTAFGPRGTFRANQAAVGTKRTWIIAGVALALAAQPIAGVAEEALSLEASPPLSPEPGLIRLLVRVERDSANRNLIVEVNSQALFRSSLITLEGDSARVAHWLEFDSLPAGAYSVTAILYRSDGETITAADSFTVVP
jgi:hypothetical protein